MLTLGNKVDNLRNSYKPNGGKTNARDNQEPKIKHNVVLDTNTLL